MKKLSFPFIIVLTSIFIAVSFSSCVSLVIPKQNSVPKKIVIATEGVVIEAADNSFRMTSGEVYDTPFASPTDNINLHLPKHNVTQYYLEAMEKFNAAPVIIHYPGREDPIYGVLLISHLFPNVIGPAAASYQIEIRSQDINALKGGNIVTVFENYEMSRSYQSLGQNLKPKSWILWMSNVPLW